MLSGCPDDEPMTPGDEGLDAAVDDTLLETSPIQSPLQVFAGMGGLALIAERLPMLYPDVIQQVSVFASLLSLQFYHIGNFFVVSLHFCFISPYGLVR